MVYYTIYAGRRNSTTIGQGEGQIFAEGHVLTDIYSGRSQSICSWNVKYIGMFPIRHYLVFGKILSEIYWVVLERLLEPGHQISAGYCSMHDHWILQFDWQMLPLTEVTDHACPVIDIFKRCSPRIFLKRMKTILCNEFVKELPLKNTISLFSNFKDNFAPSSLPPWWSALSPIVRHAVENEWLADNVR